MRCVGMPALGLFIGALVALPAPVPAGETITGDPLDPTRYGRSYVESMADAIARDRFMPLPPPKYRTGQHGVWAVPTRGSSSTAHSGRHYITNKWGDTRMGIAFPQPVTVRGAYVLGQGDDGTWTSGLRVVGYRDGRRIDQTGWFQDVDESPDWFAIDLVDVDRIEFVATPVINGGGWYGLDDLTYEVTTADGPARRVVVDFDDLNYRRVLTGTDYAGLTWEEGSGDFSDADAVHAPVRPPGAARGDAARGTAQPSGTRATTPILLHSFQGVIRGDAGSTSYPPDTDGAVGPDHYVITVNRNFAVYDKATGTELTNILLGAFLPESNGDPRVLFDQHSQRWIVIVTDFSATARIFLAVSLTDDPMGDWFKTSFATDEGSDEGNWPDYPTLGVDASGIYTAAYMVGDGNMTIFAINKAPLLATPPTLGNITAFRQLPWEGAIQPAHTYGTPRGAYFVSLYDSSSLRVRQLNMSHFPAVLEEIGTVDVPAFSDPPNAPALGSGTPLNTVGDRLMMAVYRAGSLWTCHTIAVNGRAGCRWYEIDARTLALVQQGTVADSALYYFFPSIMVNAAGDAVMGFTGSSASQYAGCYYTGRLASDPLGEMAPPELYQAGTGPQNNIDTYGRNRWGDYSYTTLDPTDEATFYTIQEYGHATNIWGTYVAALSLVPPDCNNNGVPDDEDIASGTSLDCNDNGIPDECETDNDCNGNGIPDDCDIAAGTSADCNDNATPDECDIAAGLSNDCQPNGIPDDCEIPDIEVDIAFTLDTSPGWTTEGLWAWGQPTGSGGAYGGPDPDSGYSGPNVYGYNLNGDYSNGMGEVNLTSAAIDCSALEEVHVSYWRWLGVEQPAYDHAAFKLSTDGVNFIPLWANTAEVDDGAWVYQEFDIADLADHQPTVYLRWTMGPTDGGWTYCGWNIDDVVIAGLSTAGGPGDCNANAVPDACDIADGTSADCNGNGIPDSCDIADGTSQDADGDGVPDECTNPPLCRGDANCSGNVNWRDVDFFVAAQNNNQSAWAAMFAPGAPTCPFLNNDTNEDGNVNWRDVDPFVALQNTTCP